MAKPVTVTISHELGRAEAAQRIRNGFDKVGDGLGFAVKLNQRWEDDTLHFGARTMGQAIDGTVVVEDEQVTITVVLPGLLAGMADKIMGSIRKQSTILLEKK
ncbi:polyhydroxyalkanoic acid system family protein [Oricola cellulosilytica]|uniref:Polyhydroxyalkanoic acid system protein n=1 Tax=Oricola cellulosilytica TaxID=1429082 RepID=A0A4R0PFA8_9HYPH|nr:polyhydroxyalkanoic acid system family protein [Oricola cellulosilytica]TCD16516.1 polyhydroxyalkanoic acid system protein [Oricola cellulosilytica]